MFGYRKLNRRRNERRELLDVKALSGPRREARRRMIALGLLAVALLSLGAVAGGRIRDWCERYVFFPAGRFAIQTIDIQSTGWLTAEEILQWSGVKRGDNLMAVNLARLKRDLELAPQVESVSLERVLPHTLKVRVVEREAVARIEALQPGGGGELTPTVYYVDKAGVVFCPATDLRRGAEMKQALEWLPVVRGPGGLDLRPGRSITAASVQAALRLIYAFDRSPMANEASMRAVRASSPDVLLVSTDQGAEITLAVDNIKEQLLRWRLVRDAGLKQGRNILSLDLSVTNNSPVVWADSDSPAPRRPLQVEPSPNHG